MGTGSRDLNLGEARPLIGRPRALKPSTASVAAGVAGIDLANDRLGRSVVSDLTLAEAILASIADRIAVVDHDGVIAAINAAWTRAPFDAAQAPRVGVNCFDWYRQMGADDKDVQEVADGVLGVARDGAPMFQATLFMQPSGRDAWSLITATPLRYRSGGAVLMHGDVSAQRQAERALGEMGSRVAAAQEEERSRIARELHDDLGQQTALLATNIETLLRASKASNHKLRDGIVEARQNVQDLASSIHNLSHELHPPKLKLLGLVKTLESLCRNVSKGSGMHVSFRAETLPLGVPEHISLCICRVAQEALQNAVKHSGASEAMMELRATDSALLLQVRDGGRGFDPSASTESGIGLTTMRDRVELIGGRLSITASPAGGVTIDASVPFVPTF